MPKGNCTRTFALSTKLDTPIPIWLEDVSRLANRSRKRQRCEPVETAVLTVPGYGVDVSIYDCYSLTLTIWIRIRSRTCQCDFNLMSEDLNPSSGDFVSFAALLDWGIGGARGGKRMVKGKWQMAQLSFRKALVTSAKGKRKECTRCSGITCLLQVNGLANTKSESICQSCGILFIVHQTRLWSVSKDLKGEK